jgi:dihydroflavonol-4-reductase
VTVHALARSPAAATTITDLGAAAIRGDLVDRVALAEAMHGCDVVFHVAGINRMCPRDPTELYAANVDGAAKAVHAAADAGVARIVLTSSSATIGERAGAIGREDTPHRGTFLSHYERSKFLGERAARAAAEDRGVDLVVVNPSSVQGPGRTTGAARILLHAANARTTALFDTSFSFVDVEDCAAGHLLAAAAGIPGERYLLSAQTLTMRSAIALLRDATGRPRRVVWIPRAAVRAAVPLTRLARASEDPPACPAMLRTLLHGHRYDGSRATRELGLHYRAIEQTLDRMIAWYRTRSMLPEAAA